MAEAGKQSVAVRIGVSIAIIGGLIGAFYGIRMATGTAVGGKCGENFDCKPGSVCISKRCYKSCSKDSDCPAEWSCRDTGVWITSSSLTENYKLDTGKERICFSPAQMAPARAEEARRKAEDDAHRAALDLILKKQRVFNAMLMKTLPLPGKTVVKVSNQQFDVAWDKLPQADRVAQSDDVLADRIIEMVRTGK